MYKGTFSKKKNPKKTSSVWLCVTPLETTKHLDSHLCESASPVLHPLPGKSWNIFKRLVPLNTRPKKMTPHSLYSSQGTMRHSVYLKICVSILKCSVSLSNYINRNRHLKTSTDFTDFLCFRFFLCTKSAAASKKSFDTVLLWLLCLKSVTSNLQISKLPRRLLLISKSVFFHKMTFNAGINKPSDYSITAKRGAPLMRSCVHTAKNSQNEFLLNEHNNPAFHKR